MTKWIDNAMVFVNTGKAGSCPKCKSADIEVQEHIRADKYSLSLRCKKCGSAAHFDGIRTKSA